MKRLQRTSSHEGQKERVGLNVQLVGFTMMILVNQELAATCTHPESQTTCVLFDCPAVPLSASGPSVRLIVATSPATPAPASVGEQRAETVYELFVSTLPSPAFTAKDVLELYLHRGSFETVPADEDGEQDAHRWVSHTTRGQECFQILAQWLWNLRLELGQHLAPAVVRTTEFSPAHVVSPVSPTMSNARYSMLIPFSFLSSKLSGFWSVEWSIIVHLRKNIYSTFLEMFLEFFGIRKEGGDSA